MKIQCDREIDCWKTMIKHTAILRVISGVPGHFRNSHWRRRSQFFSGIADRQTKVVKLVTRNTQYYPKYGYICFIILISLYLFPLSIWIQITIHLLMGQMYSKYSWQSAYHLPLAYSIHWWSKIGTIFFFSKNNGWSDYFSYRQMQLERSAKIKKKNTAKTSQELHIAIFGLFL